MKLLVGTFLVVFAALCFASLGFFTAYQIYRIPSVAMLPTLKIGDKILVNKRAYRSQIPQRGDIIIFKSPPEADKREIEFVKRVIALPGDTVDLHSGEVYLNGKALSEPYLLEKKSTQEAFGDSGSLKFPYHVPKNRYFVMGDNRSDSFDSRFWGPVEGNCIRGKVVRVIR